MNIEQTNKHLCSLAGLLVDSQDEALNTLKLATERASKLPVGSHIGQSLYCNRLRNAADDLRVHAERCRSVADELDRLSGGVNG